MLKILEDNDRVAQILRNLSAHVIAHAMPHNQQRHRRKPGSDEHHGEQKARSQPRPGYSRAVNVASRNLQFVLGGRSHVSQRTNL